ncbi:metal-dependent transcriptional regulator [Raineyella fluvialis]|uniref:Dihydrofolate reductase n=1 Tax=Raineyella fluvialis TaxID=2662261 RepID=A0A5Q2FH47_9ACTN|nr:metal-dependent transcriptional regulator [Raineyella fluvialis]QGF24025.1 dihydrofolate reductase [Raineyella fluvialis]
MSDLIDTTEMYLRTIFELGEEGIVPMRARIAERLHQSGPTVSQTVARMERDGLLTVRNDRHLELTAEGHERAMRVMRKHRLAERLLSDVIGLDWELVHDEACRWEHVISDEVERKLVTILHTPVDSPYGNPIPGLDELGVAGSDHQEPAAVNLVDLLDRPVAGPAARIAAVVVRFSEQLQTDPQVLATLHEAGVAPGVSVEAFAVPNGIALVPEGLPGCELAREAAAFVFVAPTGTA